MIISRSFILRIELFQTKVVEKIKTHFFSMTFFKSCLLRDNVKKCCRDGQVTDGIVALMHFMLDI